MSRARTIGLYSASGNGKTSQCVALSRYIKAKYNKTTRLISSDPGGWAPVEDEGLIIKRDVNNTRINDGIVDAFDITNRKTYLADLRGLAKGKWPKVVRGDPNILGEDPKNLYRKQVLTTQEEWAGIGAYFIEGLTSISAGFISHISKQDNSKESLTKVMYTAPGYDEDGEHFGATDQGHVGMVQNEILNLINQFGTLPVEVVMWTSHVGSVSEKSVRRMGISSDNSGELFGPKTSGTAKTAETPSWFSSCFHLHEVIVNDGNRVILAYFQNHKDPLTGNTFLAKVSMGPTIYQKLKEEFPLGYITMSYDKGIVQFLEFVDKLKGEK